MLYNPLYIPVVIEISLKNIFQSFALHELHGPRWVQDCSKKEAGFVLTTGAGTFDCFPAQLRKRTTEVKNDATSTAPTRMLALILRFIKSKKSSRSVWPKLLQWISTLGWCIVDNFRRRVSMSSTKETFTSTRACRTLQRSWWRPKTSCTNAPRHHWYHPHDISTVRQFEQTMELGQQTYPPSPRHKVWKRLC